MEFTCFVCNRTFSRPQDRHSHLHLKQDKVHQEYVRRQATQLRFHFSNAVAVASKASRPRNPAHGLMTAPQAPRMAGPSLRASSEEEDFPPHELVTEPPDVNQGDLPLSHDMEIDSVEMESLLDEEGSIVSSPDDIVNPQQFECEEEGEWNNLGFEARLLNAARSMGMDVEDAGEVFDFLPDPEVEDSSEDNGGLGSATSAHPQMHRVLLEDDSTTRTWHWHPTAGKVYDYESTVHERWQNIFSKGNDGNPGQEYWPFNSRLDWEIAQWAVKEKITQRSFNRLLQIPQVFELINTFCTILISILVTRMVGLVLHKCSIHVTMCGYHSQPGWSMVHQETLF